MWHSINLLKKKLNKKSCLSSLKSISNRGPDKIKYQFFLDNKLFIANTILSIIPKLDNSSNLYRTDDKRFFGSYNGEIYNFNELKQKNKNKIKFKTSDNDTKTLIKLHQYFSPLQIVKNLKGMFAYLIFDSKKKKIYYATDTQGEKKLFKYEDENLFILSSTVKGILSVDGVKKKFNKETTKDYFKTRHFLIQNSIYKNISQVKNSSLYTYDFKKIKRNLYFDPINLINKKIYKKFNDQTYDSVISFFDMNFKKLCEKMRPKNKFGIIFSGGIDSSLQASYLLHDKNSVLACINHSKKDNITQKINKNFLKFTKKKINIIHCNSKKYYENLKDTYKKFQHPLVAHDLIGMNLIFDFFKKKKIKVVFGASGADELFGGYELYKKVNWASKKNINMSPYSSFIKTKNISKLEKYYNKIWIRAFNKYYKFTNKNEAKIQASLFVDYFGQSLDKDNISIDAMAGENSLEIRNMFINKETIKYAINLPIKYKLNLLNKNDLMKTKPILKNLFIKKFSKELVFKKQGFSGFPNETKRYLTKNECLELKKYQGRQKKTKENDWKNLNLFFFKKYLNY